MRNSNKSPKRFYSALVRELEKSSGIRIWDRIATNSSSLCAKSEHDVSTKLAAYFCSNHTLTHKAGR